MRNRRNLLSAYGCALFGLLLNLFLPIASAQASSASQDQSGVFICGWIQDMQANLSGGNVPAGADRGAVDPIKACDFCLLACEKPAQDAARAGLAQSPLPTAIHGGWLAVHYGPAGMVGTVSIRAPPAV
ncbi:DUF2946 family protein [Aestuariispira insulae]|uniref:DUF2946 family protein n=1 Tax=Aestuariispira insulae TaxID=1461337 RepID=UPI001FE59795|nr:DUF2946 family protein [Aestuariispira insulae]